LAREFDQAEVLATHALELSEKNDFPNEAALCRCMLGHAQGQLGRTTEAIRNIRRGIADLLRVGAYLGIGTYTQYLAQALKGEGLVAEALETIEQALSQDFDKPIARPEALRIRAELRLHQRQSELAENDLHDSIALARSMGAKAYELRTTISLARLLASQGRRDEARTMLAEIYNWFTEGFDTADLKDAKTLSDELNEASRTSGG
jgi:tetratricopeptide (TPR) repeat protein